MLIFPEIFSYSFIRSKLNSKRIITDIGFLATVFLFQLLFVFQGLDFADQGAYATCYQYIFSEPESIQFYFRFWLSLIIGGSWLTIFPGMGLIGIRIAGVLVTTLTITFVYYLLKKYISVRSLITGLILALIILSCKTPSEMYYNNLSVFFWVSATVFLFYGLKKENRMFIFIAGIILGINVFNRLPNILGIGMILAVFYYGWIFKARFSKIVYDSLLFISGFFAAIGVLLIIMYLTGYFEMFIDSVFITRTMGESNDNSHNLSRLVMNYLFQMRKAVVYSGLFFTLLILYLILLKNIKEKYRSLISKISIFAGVGLVIVLLIEDKIAWLHLEYFVIGSILINGAFVIFNSRYEKELRLLSLLGILMLLIYPVGSAGAFYTAGRFALWIALPITLAVLENFNTDNLPPSFNKHISKFNFSLSVTGKVGYNLYVLPVLIAGLWFAFSSPYFDNGNRLEMFYSVDHPKLKGIYTTGERAEVVEELIAANKKYIHEGERVIAFDNIPMYYYLTNTIPFLKNPWPGMYPDELFEKDMITSLENTSKLPGVVMQKVNTLNTNWPENDKEEYPNNRGTVRFDYIMSFLDKNKYVKVWENKAFAILLPEI